MIRRKTKHINTYHSKNPTVGSNIVKKLSVMQYHENKLKEYNTITKLEQELAKLTAIDNSGNSGNSDKHTLEKKQAKVDKLQKELDTLLKNQNDYLLSISGIISDYLDLDATEKEYISKMANSGGNTGGSNGNVLENSGLVHLDDDKSSYLYSMHNKRNDLTLKFLKVVDPDNKHITKEYTDSFTPPVCPNCDMEYTCDRNDGSVVCISCGHSPYDVNICTDMSYKELQNYVCKPQYTYQKESHFADHLRRFTARENKVIDQHVLDMVIIEAQKQRITDLNTLSEEMVKKFLKKLNLNDYYDNVISIINHINERPPIELTTEVENKIKHMFKQIQIPFHKHKPPTRKNFLSYSYVLYQFFTLLDLGEFKKYFPLLKSSDKLRQQDEIWKKIVYDMALIDKSVDWKFYPTI
jgi:hypothetical protein